MSITLHVASTMYVHIHCMYVHIHIACSCGETAQTSLAYCYEALRHATMRP